MTNAGQLPDIVLHVPRAPAGLQMPDVSRFEASSVFIANNGDMTPTTVTLESVVGDPTGTDRWRLHFAPASKLNADEWYSFHVDFTGYARMLTSNSAQTPISGDSYALCLFTGSAPRITHVSVSAKNAEVRVDFSEPVRAPTLSADGLITQASVQVSSCLQLNGKCTSTLADDVALGFVDVTTASFDIKLPTRFALPPNAQGETRTAAVGASKTADVVDSGGAIVWDVPAAAWVSGDAGWESDTPSGCVVRQ